MDLTVTRIDRALFDYNATLQWNSSLPGSAQSVIDNYTVVITPGEQTPISFVLDSPTLLATLQYNIENVISITAINCVGRSLSFVSTIQYSKYDRGVGSGQMATTLQEYYLT